MHQSDVRHNKPSLNDKLNALYNMRGGGPKIDMSLRPSYLRALAALGNPHHNLPPVIHVAGTNGKGSTLAFLQAVFEEAGYRVHKYTSPHLVRFNERIILGGRQIDDETLESLIDEVMAVETASDLTFFEAVTAFSMAAFARHPADIVLLETGMGGRLDCTNIIDKPLLTIITKIGYDHMEFLGQTIEQIAAEKAGIIKTGVPCILAEQDYEAAEDVIETIAEEKKAPLYKVDAGLVHEFDASYLRGSYMTQNARTAISSLERLKAFSFDKSIVNQGLNKMNWPARMENIASGRLASLIPNCAELWLDGGHNPDGARAIATQIRTWKAQDNLPLCVVVGMMRKKDPAAFVQPFADMVDMIAAIGIEGEPDAFKGAEIAGIIEKNQKFSGIQSFETVASLNRLTLNEPHRVLICGSFYLMGRVLAYQEQS